jgi:hypothetical protein
VKYWDKEKNQKLKRERGAGFDDILADGVLLDVLENKNYPGQEILVFDFRKYVWAVVRKTETGEFITLWPDRKLKRGYRK